MVTDSWFLHDQWKTSAFRGFAVKGGEELLSRIIYDRPYNKGFKKPDFNEIWIQVLDRGSGWLHAFLGVTQLGSSGAEV